MEKQGPDFSCRCRPGPSDSITHARSGRVKEAGAPSGAVKLTAQQSGARKKVFNPEKSSYTGVAVADAKRLNRAGRSVRVVADLIGQRFGNYRSISLLGEGGMGAVYLAEHPDIGRKVAVKVLRSEFSRDEQLLGRFLNEARAANAIRHPNIIEILDSGTTEQGMPYLVMELLEGEVLAGRMRRLGRLPLPTALEFTYQTASAVGAAHRKSIVHRDLKPDNLFIVPDENDPARERIKVLDFGIAKLQVHAMGDSVKTRTGTLMGTPVYMSPEQAMGTKEVDHRSDIYSLGVILFEMVCGKPPFFSQGFGELVHLHLNVPPPPPRTLVPSLPLPMESLILKMLAKRPEDRFPSMASVQEAIKQVSAGQFPVRGNSSPDFSGGTLPIAGSPGPTPMPAVDLGRQSTTFSTHGERLPEAGATRPSRAPRRAVIALVAAATVAGGWFVVSRRQPTGPEVTTGPDKPALPAPIPAPPVPPRTRMVKIAIDSRPGGARIVRISDGANLGVTPWSEDLPAGEGTLEVRLDKDGYEPARAIIALFGDQREEVQLKPKAVPPKILKKHTPRPEEPAKL
jgi:serine/threonine protein kinase